MAIAQPAGQQRNAFERDHGNFATVAAMPNGSGNVLPSASVPFTLEAGDTCYLSLSTGQCQYLCISAGTSGGGDAVWVPSSGQGPWSSVLYVDNVRGSDTTGQRGNANRPFATIQAAINAMSTNDLVLLAPRTFLLATPLTVPAAVVHGSIQGMSQSGLSADTATGFFTQSHTTLAPTAAATLTAYFDLGVNAGLTSWAIANMRLGAVSGNNFSATVADVKADGSSYALGTFLQRGLDFNFVFFGDSAPSTVVYRYIGGGATHRNCISNGAGAYSVTQCALTLVNTLAPTSPCVMSSDQTDPLDIQATLRVTAGSVIGGSASANFITMTGQARVFVDQTSTVGGLKGVNLAAGSTRFPALVCSGSIGLGNSATIDFASAGAELPDTATALTWDLRGARLLSTTASASAPTTSGPTTAKFKVGGVAGNFQTVKLDDVTALPGCTFTADAKIHLTMRGANVPTAVYTTPGADGDIIPPTLSGTIDIAAGGALVKTWVNLGFAGLIRTGVAPTTCLVTSAVQGADAVVPVAGKVVTGFTITSTAQAGNTANWMATFP